jgi:shikimate dehydrogenase
MSPARYSLGLVGYPLEHSLSPCLHEAALKSTGLEGEYRLYPIPSTTEGGRAIQSLLERMRQGDIQGLNLTIPYKRTVLPLLDELAPTARATGAVNTVCLKEGKLVGENTDVPGFRCDLERQLAGQGFKIEMGEKTALVLGAGGSARAVVYALAKEGWKVMVAARRIEQAKQLSPEVKAYPVVRLDAEALRELIAQTAISLLVNTTPVGMGTYSDGCAWPLEVSLPNSAFVYDLVYNPPVTRLLRAARDAGLPAANGLGMLVEQAALSFTVWTDHLPDREAMLAAVT